MKTDSGGPTAAYHRFLSSTGGVTNVLLWVRQGLTACMYAAAGIMKVFLFDKISKDVPSLGAMPREAWMYLGIFELVCTVGLIVPSSFRCTLRLSLLRLSAGR